LSPLAVATSWLRSAMLLPPPVRSEGGCGMRRGKERARRDRLKIRVAVFQFGLCGFCDKPSYHSVAGYLRA
jgi:hypothetical protein